MINDYQKYYDYGKIALEFEEWRFGHCYNTFFY